jgi:hypothetical protein
LSRLPVAAFGALVVATIAAFFVTQHLKVTTPLIAGIRIEPSVINPRAGVVCGGVDHRTTTISFYLLYRADAVDVYVIDESGTIVRTLASGRHMRRAVRNPDGNFYWDGREDNGTAAPDGTYSIEVALIHQGRTLILSNPAGPLTAKIKSRAPQPVVNAVSPRLIPRPGGTSVTIRYSGNERRGGTVQIYRTDLPGRPRLVKSFATPWNGQSATWDGKIRQRPAPPGVYLMGLDVTDAACNTGHFPRAGAAPPRSTAHAGVTVRYLSAQPPLEPVTAGSAALVYVDSRRQPYRWWLRRSGHSKPVSTGKSDQVTLRVPLPRGRAGLYELTLRARRHVTTVPLVAASPTEARTLVVLPALTWQGLNPVDDTGSGIPATLESGGPIKLARPLARGLPAGIADESALLSFLDASHRSYQLTTDLALIEGVGPGLSGHTAVVLAGSERWLPSATASALRSYVERGGRVLSLGIDSLRRAVTVQSGRALDPAPPAKSDALGAQPGALVNGNPDLIAVGQDALGIFQGTSGAFAGYGSYQPFTLSAPATILSSAGAKPDAPSIVGYSLGRGTVVDIGLAGFASSLSHNVAAAQLAGRIWKVLSG